MPITPLQEARALATEMHWQLWIDMRRKGIDVTKEQVDTLVTSRGEKQIFAPLQRAEGKSLVEDIHFRWHMDLADLKNQKVKHKTKRGGAYSAFLVRIDCFSSQIWAKSLKQKMQEAGKNGKAVSNRKRSRPRRGRRG